jgi:F-type H+-transporting ATPase subunit alpha
LRSQHTDILNAIRDSGDLASATEAKLKSVVDGYVKTFA